MYAQELFDISIALMFATKDEEADYTDQFIPVLNLLLGETFDTNNSIRVSKEMQELTEIPTITALTDAIPYEDAICRRVLPYGLAGQLMMEDNASIAIQYKNKYEFEKATNFKAVYTDIADYTSEGAE